MLYRDQLITPSTSFISFYSIVSYPFQVNSYLILFIIFTYSYSLQANDEEPSELVEEFVEFLVGKSRGTNFFPVMMNEEEEPYVDVHELLSNWIDIEVQCEVERQYCEGILYPEGKIYWIDAQQRQYGSNDPKHPGGSLTTKEVAFIDGKIWLKYNLYPKWLPVNAFWTLYRYALAMTTNYLSLKDQKVQRELIRKQHRYRQQLIDKIKRTPVLIAPEESAIEVRYGVNTNYNHNSRETTYGGTIQMLGDQFAGTWQLNSSFNQEQLKPELDGYRYDRFEWLGLHHMEFGDTRSFSGLLVGARSLKNGFNFESNETVDGAGNFEYWDNFRPDTEVDIFKNGILIDTTMTDGTGQFRLPEQVAAGGDIFEFRLYYTNGETEIKRIRIAPDNSLLLEPGKWDYKTALGETNKGKLAQFSLRRGITDLWSIGAHNYLFKHEDGTELGVVLDSNYRLTDNTNLAYELMAVKGSRYQTLSSIYTGFEGHQIFINLYDVEHSGAKIPQLPRNITDNLLTIDHSTVWNRWNIISRLSKLPKEIRLDQSLSRKLHSRISLNTVYNLLKKSDEPIDLDIAVTTIFRIFDQNDISLTFQSGEAAYETGTRFRIQATEDHPWGVDFSINYSKAAGVSKSFSATWRYEETMEIGFSTDGKNFGLNLSWNQAHSLLRPGISYKHFGSGTVEGYALAPENEDGEQEPIPGMKVYVGGRFTESDEQGYFRLDGVPPHRKTMVKYDNNSLDVTYTLVDDFSMVKVRPGSRVQVAPEILGAVGFDGVYYTNIPIPNNAVITITDRETQELAGEIVIEEDGFFIAEQLSPGKYLLEVTNIDPVPEPLILNISANEDWLSDISLYAQNYVSPEATILEEQEQKNENKDK